MTTRSPEAETAEWVERRQASPAGASGARFNAYEAFWPLKTDVCPCDVHFQQYLEEHQVRDRVIFHFGTGGHHLLGRRNCELGGVNQILGVTASRAEYASYVDLLAEKPEVSAGYKVLYTDVYTLSARLLPDFDLVTLFHLCEYYDAASDYAVLDDGALVDLFLDRLSAGGRLLFYSGSRSPRRASPDEPSGFELALPIIEQRVRCGRMVKIGEYKSLWLYGRPGSSDGLS